MKILQFAKVLKFSNFNFKACMLRLFEWIYGDNNFIQYIHIYNIYGQYFKEFLFFSNKGNHIPCQSLLLISTIVAT